RVAGNQGFPELELERLAARGQRLQLFLAHAPELGIRIRRHLLGRGEVRAHALPFPEQRDHGLEACVLARQLAEPCLFPDHFRIGEQRGGFLEAFAGAFELADQRGFHRTGPPSSLPRSRPNSSRAASTKSWSAASPACRRRTVGRCSSFFRRAPVTYSSTASGSAPLCRRRRACASTSWRSASPWSRSAAITGDTERLRSISR